MTDVLPGLVSVYDDLPDGRVSFLHMDETGIATGFNGHVDLGTGIETALAQIVAEELDLPLDRVRIVLGDTARTPDQGATIASETIQIAAVPLRIAAAQLRAFLLGAASQRLNTPVAELQIDQGRISAEGVGKDYGELIAGLDLAMRLDPEVPVKNPADYRIVGQPVGRRDLPQKVTGAFGYIQDFRLDGMLHGHVVRPPYSGRDSGDFVGQSLVAVDESSVADMPGLIAIVREGDFLGVVAETAPQARDIAEALIAHWRIPPPLPDMSDLHHSLKAQPSSSRLLDGSGDFDRGIAACGIRLSRTYLWPYHEHGSIGPSCAVADWNDGRPVVWSGTQNPHMLRGDLAVLMQLEPPQIEVRRLQAAGCYGRNCADDVCGDALLMSKAVGRPVRVQLTRAQEHLWEPKGAAQLMEVEGGIGPDGDIGAYAIDTWYPSNRGPNLALLLTGRISPEPRPSDMGDRTIIPPYRVPNKRITVHDMAPVVRAAWMRGVSALPNTFAHESFMDELAHEAGEDPVAFRIRHLDDPNEADLVRRTAEAGGWAERSGPRFRCEGRMAYGQGFAFATYVHGTFPGKAAASAAWVCDVTVDLETGEVTLTRVFVGQDQGLVINPDGVRAQIHGNVIQTASRALREEVTFNAIVPTPKSWAGYPIQTFDEAPRIETMLIERPGSPALGVGESAAVPAAAAIANAIFDATGVRLREAPFTPQKVRAALGIQPPAPTALPGPVARMRRALATHPLTRAIAAVTGALTLGAIALPIHSAIPAQRAPAASVFSADTIERGRQVFAVGDCAVCHTAEGGLANAGGRGMQTPFGTVYTTNLTPDPETGLGNWSFAAFERAMRHGISRDGKNLYPAFPYTAFAKIDDGDMYALYAYLQTLPAVASETPRSTMLAPTNLRPVNAAWNLMFHDPKPLQNDPAQSADWNRGRYLVEAAGHCSACHTPRNLMGAEKSGRDAYGGALIDDWWAPALSGVAAGSRGWDQDSLYTYLRNGHAPGIASASGPMAEVVHSLQGVPDQDLRAMSVYLASLVTPAPLRAVTPADVPPGPGAATFRAACASCHAPGLPGAVTAAQVDLTQSAAIRAPMRDGLMTVIRDGIEAPLDMDLRDMPGFAQELDASQLRELTDYLRARYAPDLPAWP
ncbi:molybdopterin cofactor-binding domain-containing protein [Paracoccus shanxieyensis]|uniref:Molybdopterin-dependent oxidoreductase n=1 Tax=Paracoccus shanxieyensis TaxID=2675752 RepID=A0A6L6IV57_9RHOB|nr:molybdopterin cofactor-binding domain-containing protein [Paracoccus shanxieyensis]MTH64083.1 molybdopterin-dependent oxidoreductase [Paracoccus shanxieyensis]MTH86876.1 molybdopterin-dependent oxidoreductase [Paracoccus shanxieyensis]